MECFKDAVTEQEAAVEYTDACFLSWQVDTVKEDELVVAWRTLHDASITGKGPLSSNDWLPYMASLGDVC